MRQAEFSADGDARADIVVVGSGVVGAMIADQLSARGHSVLILEAGLRIERAQAVENWRNMPFANRLGSDFQGLYPQSAGAGAAVFPRKQLRSPDRSQRQRLQAGLSAHRGRHHLALGGVLLAPPAGGPAHAIGLRRGPRLADLIRGAGALLPAGRERDGRGRSQRSRAAIAGRAQRSLSDGHGAVGLWRPAFRRRGEPAWLPLGAHSAGPQHAALARPSHLLRQQQLSAYLSGRRHVQRHPSCPGGRGEGRHRAQAVVYKIDTDENNRVTAVHWYDQARKSQRPPAGISCWPATRWKPRACCSWPPMNATRRHCQFV